MTKHQGTCRTQLGTHQGRAAADANQATYEFGTELTDGGGVAAVTNQTYGESGQRTGADRRGQMTR